MLWIDHVQVLQGSSQLHHVQVAISMIASCPINDIRSNLRVSQWSARRSLSICLLLPLCTTEVPRCQTATHETFFQWYRPYWIMLIICLCSKVNIFILGSRHWACMYMHMYMIRLWFQILFVFICYNSELLILWQCKVVHSWMLLLFCSRFLPACRRCLSSDLGDCLVPTRDYRPYVGLFPMIDGKLPSPHTLLLVQLDPRQVVK